MASGMPQREGRTKYVEGVNTAKAERLTADLCDEAFLYLLA